MKIRNLLAGVLTVILAAGALGAEFPKTSAPPAPEPSTTAKPAAKETWYRVYLYEYDNGRKRSAGTFENPDRGRCERYGKGWVEGDPKKRTYEGPFSFTR